MSKTLFAEFRGRGFWVFDVVSGVFLKHLIDAATPRLNEAGQGWLSEAVRQWRISSVISDFGLFLDDDWSVEQVRMFTELATAACDQLSKRAEIPAEEIASWPMLDDERIFPRGLPSVDTASVIRLGRALTELVNGTLQDAPDHTWWFFGAKDSPRTLPMRRA